MKKRICILVSGMIFVGTVSAFGANYSIDAVPHIYTAKVGTTDFSKDGVLQPSDAEIYIKDGYVMLPMRTFFSALDTYHDIVWNAEQKTATLLLQSQSISFDVQKNEILQNGEKLKVFGKLEIKNGRLFIPLRNWDSILNSCGYEVKSGDITWDAENKEATVKVKAFQFHRPDNLPKPAIFGEGQAPVYTLPFTREYDAMENVGDGLLIAKKYPHTYVVIDPTGKELATWEQNTVSDLEYIGEGYFLAQDANTKQKYVVDKNGNMTFDMPYEKIDTFSEGLACVQNQAGKYGYVDKSGKLSIPCKFDDAKPFSDGLAVVAVGGMYGYIDKNGDFFIEPNYILSRSFSEGLAGVKTESGLGYINRKGEEVIAPQYQWASPFVNGTAYVVEAVGEKVWLINQKGEKLKLLGENAYIKYDQNGSKEKLLMMEEIVHLPNKDHMHVYSFYDETGEISKEMYDWKQKFSDGLIAEYDAKTNLYGYADATGKRLIASIFAQAEPFQDGYAVVARNVVLENGQTDTEWAVIQSPLSKNKA